MRDSLGTLLALRVCETHPLHIFVHKVLEGLQLGTHEIREGRSMISLGCEFSVDVVVQSQMGLR